MATKKPVPPTYFFIFLILSLAAHLVYAESKFIFMPWNLSGILLLFFGTYLNLAADKAFKKAGTTVKPFEESSELITDGVFRLSRNPMYLGMAAILLGVALLLGSLLPFVITILFLPVIDHRFIRTEEQMLADKFGAEWEAYKKAVRRWI